MRKYTSKATPKGVKITRNSLEQLYAAQGTTERTDSTRPTADPTRSSSKRDREEDETEVIDVARKLDEQRDKMKKALEKAGSLQLLALFDEMVNKSLQIQQEAFDRQLSTVKEEVRRMLTEKDQKIQVIAAEMVEKAIENDRCGRSLLIHNADKLLGKDDINEKHYNIDWGLAPKVARAMSKMCKGMVHITDSYLLGRWQDGRPPTSVCIVLDNARMKSVIFRIMAARIRAEKEDKETLQQIILRDVFPRDQLEDARKEVRRGMILKKRGIISSFKVVGTGPTNIPILEVRRKGEHGLPKMWEVFQTSMLDRQQLEEMRKELGETGQLQTS